jgi:hypothetical protein
MIPASSFYALARSGCPRLAAARDRSHDINDGPPPNPLNQTAHVQSRHVESAAKAMSVDTYRIEMRGQEDLAQISKAIATARVRGLIVVLDLVTIRAASSIADLAAKHHLPGFQAYREFADAGGLMSYGFSGPGLVGAVVEYAVRCYAAHDLRTCRWNSRCETSW